jgi:hypothetical protein
MGAAACARVRPREPAAPERACAIRAPARRERGGGRWRACCSHLSQRATHASRHDTDRVSRTVMCRLRMRACGYHTRGAAWQRRAPGPARADGRELKGMGEGPGVCCLLGRCRAGAALSRLSLSCVCCAHGPQQGSCAGGAAPALSSFQAARSLPLVAERRPDGVPQQVCTGLLRLTLISAGPRIRSCTAFMSNAGASAGHRTCGSPPPGHGSALQEHVCPTGHALCLQASACALRRPGPRLRLERRTPSQACGSRGSGIMVRTARMDLFRCLATPHLLDHFQAPQPTEGFATTSGRTRCPGCRLWVHTLLCLPSCVPLRARILRDAPAAIA